MSRISRLTQMNAIALLVLIGTVTAFTKLYLPRGASETALMLEVAYNVVGLFVSRLAALIIRYQQKIHQYIQTVHHPKFLRARHRSSL